jgi:dTDP-4-dehydrorhamnose reductase
MRVAVTGAAGQLGSRIVEAARSRGHEVVALARPEFDLTRLADLLRMAAWRPDVVINAAAWTDVDGCATDPDRAMLVNGTAAGAVASAASSVDAVSVQVSTNEVFDGLLERPYTEDDEPNPINPYGMSKRAGEVAVARANPRHLVVRTAWLFGGASSFPTRITAAAERMVAEGRPLRVVADEVGNPTPVGPLANQIVTIVERPDLDRIGRVLHLAGEPAVSRFDWAAAVLAASPVELEPIAQSAYPRPSRAPLRAVLATDLARRHGLPTIDWRRVGD